ncbi:hypothetical protein ACFE04_022638 [Oxalis oulophora]
MSLSSNDSDISDADDKSSCRELLGFTKIGVLRERLLSDLSKETKFYWVLVLFADLKEAKLDWVVVAEVGVGDDRGGRSDRERKRKRVEVETVVDRKSKRRSD